MSSQPVAWCTPDSGRVNQDGGTNWNNGNGGSIGWGSTSNVDDGVHFATGWDDIVIHYYGGNAYPYNYPDGGGGWDTPKHPVCARET